jgi:hypothetical protein
MSLVLLDQRFAIEPYWPSVGHLARVSRQMYWLPNLLTLPFCRLPKVTSLGPRTPHQPEKLQKLSKNNCVLHLLFFRSIEKTNLYVL